MSMYAVDHLISMGNQARVKELTATRLQKYANCCSNVCFSALEFRHLWLIFGITTIVTFHVGTCSKKLSNSSARYFIKSLNANVEAYITVNGHVIEFIPGSKWVSSFWLSFSVPWYTVDVYWSDGWADKYTCNVDDNAAWVVRAR